MILVAGQSSAARKCLLAIRVRALVRPLPRVNATMASQRTRVTEWLAASFAHVRLLASVDTLMDGQSRALNELLAAVGVVAHMGTDAAMDALMTCEVTASREALTTCRTREGFGWTRVGRGSTTIVLALRVWQLLLRCIRVVWRLRNVIVVVEHGHRGLHLRGRRVAHVVHVLGSEGGIRGERLLGLLR